MRKKNLRNFYTLKHIIKVALTNYLAEEHAREYATCNVKDGTRPMSEQTFNSPPPIPNSDEPPELNVKPNEWHYAVKPMSSPI